MLMQTGFVQMEDASRYMVRLCHHFSKKIAVVHTPQQGVAQFPWGKCTLTAQVQGIHFLCEAQDRDGLERVCNVINSHVSLFSRHMQLSVAWDVLLRC
jgi:hypothetical protein